MIRLAVLSNPHSGRNKRGMDGIERVLSREPSLRHIRLESVGELADAMDELARLKTELLVVNSGDGTVQAVLTDLFERKPFEVVPWLAILPRGMTNMTADDVGLRSGAAKSLERLLHLRTADRLERHTIPRHILRIENLAGLPPQRAMFLGGGAIVQAIQLCREKIHSRGLRSDWATGATFAGMLGSWIFRRARDKALQGNEIAFALDGARENRGQRLLVLATTLDRLILRSRPFWDDDGHPLRFTSVDYPPERLVRAVPSVLYGTPSRDRLPAGYFSRSAERVELHLDTPFTLDGQIFDPEAGKPLVITAAEAAVFVRC